MAMEKIGPVAQAALSDTATHSTKSSEPASNVSALSEHWVGALFKMLQGRYMQKWTSAMDGIEKIAVREWSLGLAGMTAADIRRGLEAWQGEWPPTLPEFAASCRRKRLGKNEFGLDYTPEVYRAAPVRDRSRLLSSADRDARRKASAKHVAAMRDALKSREAKTVEVESANVPGV